MNISVLTSISYGLYVVSSKREEAINGQIANAVFQVTSDPPTLAVSICKKNLTYEFIKESRVFTVSILSEEASMKLIGLFGFKCGRDINKFEKIQYRIGNNGAPIVLENTIGYIECEVEGSLDAGTHTIFVGKVIDADVLGEGQPLTYAYYHTIKKGREPESATTYVAKKKEVSEMDKYECTVCGYIYDPDEGDPDAGIQKGTSFESLPDDWVCPVCGAGKSDFVKVK